MKNLSFWDLRISLEEGKIVTKTHFKNVDPKSCLSMDSCHFKPWLYNIPKGQLIKIDCTKDDYRMQENLIGTRLK